MIRRIATAAVFVADQAAALRFWTEQAGFEEKRRLPMGPAGDSAGRSGRRRAESALVLYPRALMDDWAERKPSTGLRLRRRPGRLRGDVGASASTSASRRREMPWGPFAIFEDPEGNWYGLRQS